MTVGFPVRSYLKNEVIFKEGSLSKMVYILKEGTVEISINKEGRKLQLAKLKPGAIFGEMEPILKIKKRIATATALENARVTVVDDLSFQETLAKSPPIMVSLLSSLSDRLRNTTYQLSSQQNVFIGVCEVLNLLAAKGPIVVDEISDSLARAFFVDVRQVEGIFELLETMNFIARNERTVRILNPEDFISRISKVQLLLNRYGSV